MRRLLLTTLILLLAVGPAQAKWIAEGWQSGNVFYGATFGSHLLPAADDTFDLGSSGAEWRNLYVDGTATIDLLNADVLTITPSLLTDYGMQIDATHADSALSSSNLKLIAHPEPSYTTLLSGEINALSVSLEDLSRIQAGGTNSVYGINIVASAGDADTSLTGLQVTNLTTPTAGTERAISIGTGWDAGIYTQSPIVMTEVSEPSAPAADSVTFFSVDESGLTTMKTKDSTGFVAELMRDSILTVRNNSGVQIDKGRAVYLVSSTGVTPTVALAKADSASTMPAIGIAAEDIADTSFGRVILLGDLKGLSTLPTGTFSNGQLLYVSATTAGELVNAAPPLPNLDQQVGHVISASNGAAGILHVSIRDLEHVEDGTINAFTVADDLTLDTLEATGTVGDSPSLKFIGRDNNDTASIYLEDDTDAEEADLHVQLTGDTVQSSFLIKNKTGTTKFVVTAVGGIGIYGNTSMIGTLSVLQDVTLGDDNGDNVTMQGDNGNAEHVLVDMYNTRDAADSETGLITSLNFSRDGVSDTPTDTQTKHEMASIQAYSAADWFGADESDYDAGLKFYVTDGGVETLGMTLANDQSLSVVGSLQLGKIETTAPTEPTACGSTTVGTMIYVDDDDDSGAAQVCVCIATADDGGGSPNAWDWRKIDDLGTACSFF